MNARRRSLAQRPAASLSLPSPLFSRKEPPVSSPTLNWTAIAKANIHPLRVQILEHLAGDDVDKASPKEMANVLGEQLGNVSYHVSCLKKQGLVELVDTRPARGAVEHFYRLVGDRG